MDGGHHRRFAEQSRLDDLDRGFTCGNAHQLGTITLSGSNGKYIGGGTLNNAATIILAGSGDLGLGVVTGATFGSEYGIGGTLDNLSGGVFDIESDAGISGLDAPVVSGPPPTVNNAGTLVKSAGSGTSAVIATDLINSGSVEVDTCTLSVGGGGSAFSNQGGSFTVATGAILQMAATPNYDGDGTLALNGTFSASGGGEVQFSSGALTGGAGGATLISPTFNGRRAP